MIHPVTGAIALLASYAFGPAWAPTSRSAPTHAPSTASGLLADVDACAVATTRDPETVELRPTRNAPGGRGRMSLVQPSTPFGIAVDADGHQLYDVAVEVTRLRRHAGAAYVVWAATPELDQVTRLGTLGDDGRVRGPVAWNKFLVFVSEEREAAPETWTGPILLTGLSPSGRMHTMAGHGPFEDVSCADYY